MKLGEIDLEAGGTRMQDGDMVEGSPFPLCRKTSKARGPSRFNSRKDARSDPERSADNGQSSPVVKVPTGSHKKA